MPLVKSCERCGKAVSIPAYRAETFRFCSRRCTSIGTRESREPRRLAAIKGTPAHNNAGMVIKCAQCGKYFSLPPSKVGRKKFCSWACYSAGQRLYVMPQTYLRISVNGERKLEHRHIMEEILGRKLGRSEHVHHVDGDTHNNSPENLMVLDAREHGRLSSSRRANICQP